MNKAVAEQLRRFIGTNEIVSLYLDPTNMSTCSIGYIEAVDDAWVRIRAISIYGANDGYELRLLDNICRIDVGGRYERKLAFMQEHTADIFDDVPLSLPTNNEGDLIFFTLQEAVTRRLIVSLLTEDPDDSIVGYVEDIDNDIVKILSIDDYGKQDGHIFLRYQDIRAVDCNTKRAQVLKFLNSRLKENH